MRYDNELQFFLKFLKNMDIPVRIFPSEEQRESNQEPDIYSLIYADISYEYILKCIENRCRPNCVYHIYDEFFCNYLMFELPDTPKISYILIGPYTEVNIEKEAILSNLERFSLPPSFYPQIEQFYLSLSRVGDLNGLMTLINTIGAVIWGSMDNFSWENWDTSKNSIYPQPEVKDVKIELEIIPDIEKKQIEKVYYGENEFLEAVSLGQTHKAEMYMKNYSIERIERRLPDSVRNLKNYSIIFNTLLRKAAEKGGVHPIHIHKLSSEFANEIELLTSAATTLKLHKKMARKYCLLVKNHSLKSYSPLIKKVITNVDTDITADLSLKAQAKCLNINASYLSSLFKKEVGVTLTEYVNGVRINRAVNLLNTTNMQIQLVAQYCGIPDVNYFSKLFKKHIGKTPQEYRRHISVPSKAV